ncbi:hypothetical protein F4677DRAFT_453291 [Hypoxylon crocopeplum]|nr:hypothetical protein F4677DRAFT_453291 [Hypoxylon crocopeplum]
MITHQWSKLTRDVQLEVFDILAQDCDNDGSGYIGRGDRAIISAKGGLATYTTVCKEWQTFFERGSFDQYLHRQRNLVEHIWLCIELGTYTCPSCVENGYEISDPDANAISESIGKLLQMLSTWRKDQVLANGLVLEISHYSPSDSQHVFKGYLHFGSELFENEVSEKYRSSVHDPYHGWSHGRRSKHPTPTTLRPLPNVEVVKGLVIRRQSRRPYLEYCLNNIVKCLSNLEYINFEPWRRFINYVSLRTSWFALPKTMKSSTIFEDFNENWNTIRCFDESTGELKEDVEFVRTPEPSVSGAVAWMSRQLEKVCVSYMINAKDFFEAREPHFVWSKLTSLSLTSLLLKATADTSAINSMLAEAGVAALEMPKLQTMEIWNGMKRMLLKPEVLDNWDRVSQLHTKRSLSVQATRRLDPSEVKSHAAAIRKLGINEHVIHPVSLEQIDRESNLHFEP